MLLLRWQQLDILLGFVIWVVATSVYRMAGSYFFEGSSAQYWLNVIVTSILYFDLDTIVRSPEDLSKLAELRDLPKKSELCRQASKRLEF